VVSDKSSFCIPQVDYNVDTSVLASILAIPCKFWIKRIIMNSFDKWAG
jgi:hypothetical protein